MLNRRSFFNKGLLGLLGLTTASACQTKEPSSAPSKQNPNSKLGLPIVLATWNNKNATNAAWEKLKDQGSALDAVESGARVPEADPNDHSVGYGGFPDRTGVVTLDACIMDHQFNAGCVTFLEGIKHPISVARLVMEKTPHVMLSGKGAQAFALEQGFEIENLLTEESRLAWETWKAEQEPAPLPAGPYNHDTIGILAVDQSGQISGACTTSGWAYKMHGRVGDSPIIGAGMYVDNEIGGAAATGQGELIMKTLGSFLIVELMRQGYSPQAACEEAVQRIYDRYGTDMGQVGYIALDKSGNHGACSLTPEFNYVIYQNEENQVFDAPHCATEKLQLQPTKS